MQLKFTVPQCFDGALVKTFLRGHCSLSYRLMVSLKHVENGITNNGAHIRVIDRVSAGDIITLNLPEKAPKAQPLDSVRLPEIIYEDEHITVVDKPAHMPVHTSGGHYDDTLANAMAHYESQRGITRVFRPVYRLDADTSGIVVLANHAHAAKLLAGKIDKQYYAVAEGRVEPKSGRIDLPLGIKDGHGIMRCVDQKGERAVTNYRRVLFANDRSLLSIRLETGRTHQIRAHFAHLGHPLVGDWLYGNQPDEGGEGRQLLHCAFAWFTHPSSGKAVCFKSRLPDEFFSALNTQIPKQQKR